MKTAILSIGTEILFGQIVNTNASYLSRELNLAGFDVMYHYTVGDNPGRMLDMMEMAFRDCDMIITTGGLGPTQDDLTKEMVCRIMDDSLTVREDVLGSMEKYYAKTGRKMTENNRKMAAVPSRSRVFLNDAGIAPGFSIEKDGKYIICMPGPPREMKRMFQKSILPYLMDMSEHVIRYRLIRFFGIGESKLETVLMDLIDGQKDPTLATYTKDGECMLRIASKREKKEDADRAVEEVLEKVKERAGEFIYSCDDEELADVVTGRIKEKKLTLSCAEGCTGGMFASDLIGIPGVSQYFDMAMVPYTAEAKIKDLGVKRETIEKYGEVSGETALEMVERLYEMTGSDICISITDISLDEEGSGAEGTAYVGLMYRNVKSYTRVGIRHVNRNTNRHLAVLSMLDIINRRI